MIDFAPDLRLHESSVRFYGVRIATRMSAVRLRDGRLWLHSPTFLGPELRKTLDAWGPVSFVVSPNKIHHQAMPAYREAYPEACLCASPGLPARRRDLVFDRELGDTPDPAWAEEIDQAATAGNTFFSELLFLHRASGTLIVGDLVENIDAQTVSRTGRILGRLFGVEERPMASPEHRWYATDPDALARSLERPRSWPIERIALCHGALVRENAAAVFDTVCEELIEAARRRGALGRRLFTALARRQ